MQLNLKKVDVEPINVRQGTALRFLTFQSAALTNRSHNMGETASVFDSTANDFATRVDRQIASGRYRRGDLFLAAAQAHTPQGGYILDYGCGPGRISRLLAGHGFKVCGVDFSPGMVAAAKEQPLGTLQVEFKAIEEWTNNCCARSGGFDAVVCSSVIEYIPEPVQLLKRFAELLHPSGVLIISFANARSIFRAPFQHRNLHLGAQTHTWSWPKFQSLLKEADFQSVRAPRYFEGQVERVRGLNFLATSQFVGGLGLVVAKKS